MSEIVKPVSEVVAQSNGFGRKQSSNPVENEPLIGREEYSLTFDLNPEAHDLLERHTSHIITDRVAQNLGSKMHNNSREIDPKGLGRKRPASSYFTSLDGQLIIEWGEIDPKGEAKLHHYLNRSIDYIDRVKKGGIVRSGHTGLVKFSNQPDFQRVALLDSLIHSTTLTPSAPEFPIIVTLANNGILPITSDGYPVQVLSK